MNVETIERVAILLKANDVHSVKMEYDFANGLAITRFVGNKVTIECKGANNLTLIRREEVK